MRTAPVVVDVRTAVERVCHSVWPSRVDYMEVDDVLAMCGFEGDEHSGFTANLCAVVKNFDGTEDRRFERFSFDPGVDPAEAGKLVLRWLDTLLEPNQRLFKVVGVE